MSDLMTAAQMVLQVWGLSASEAERFLSDPDGAAILALLCNAKAKELPELYVYKPVLLRQAVGLAEDWWKKPHGYGDQYAADTVIFIESGVGRMQFHVRADDPAVADLVARAVYDERGWNGVALQPIAREIAERWLAEA